MTRKSERRPVTEPVNARAVWSGARGWRGWGSMGGGGLGRLGCVLCRFTSGVLGCSVAGGLVRAMLTATMTLAGGLSGCLRGGLGCFMRRVLVTVVDTRSGYLG